MSYDFEQIDNHVDQAKALLIQQFRNKPRIEALLAAFTRQCQIAEDVLWDIVVQRNVDTATGIHLDVIGRIVGQKRIGPSDDTYRLHIRVRIRINHSHGKTEDVIDVVRLLVQSDDFELVEFYPASFTVDVFAPMTEDPHFVADLMREARGAGIGAHLHYSTDPEEETFAFASGLVEESDESRGFAAIDGDPVGGSLINVA